MTRYPVRCRPAPIRRAAWLGAALLSGCAPALSSAPLPPSASSAGPAPTFFDGIYDGTRTPEIGCGFAGPIGYEVAGGSIRQRTTTPSRRLEGAIDPDGRFRMINDAGDHVVSGVVRGGRLTGTDDYPPLHHKHEHSAVEAPDLACAARIDAVRTSPGRIAPRAGPAGAD